jgi:hypothetical protein
MYAPASIFGITPIYIFFIFISFFRKHKQKKKITIIRREKRIAMRISQYHGFKRDTMAPAMTGKIANSIFKIGFFHERGARASLKNDTFCTNLQ